MLRPTRLVALLTLAIAAIVGGASSAGAIALAPTDWSSHVTSIDPPTDVVELDIVGGDAVARLSAQPGHQVLIRGYENEPYLRIDPDGSVWENVRAPSCSLNRTETGIGSLDPAADALAEPEWRRIGSNGVAIWHDHRVHPMPGVTDAIDWTIALTIDGSSTTIHGHLERNASHVPVFEVLLGICVGVGAILVGRRRPRRAALVCASVAAAVGTTISVADLVRTPDGLDPLTLPAIVTIAAFVLAVAAIVRGRHPASRVDTMLVGASLALSAGWVVWSLPALTAAIVPGAFAAPITRCAVTITAGLLLAGGVALVQACGVDQAESANL